MKGTHMSGRDLIYRDLSCWPTPLHYHPAQCLWPFLFNTVALSASPPAHCLSRHLPQPPIYTSVPLPVSFPMHIIRMCDPTKWICPHIKDSYFFLLEKQKGHAADRMRLVSLRKHPPPTTTPHPPPPHLLVAGAGKAPSCIFISAKMLRSERGTIAHNVLLFFS